MASSAYPRMYFTGHFYWNPSTYNNDDYAGSSYTKPLTPYDAKKATPTWDTFLDQQHPEVTKANFRHWSQQLYSLGPDTPLGPDQQLPPPEWNFFGGNQCGLVTDEMPVLEQPDHFSKPTGPENITQVRGWTDEDGRYADDGDPWVGLALQFNTAAHLGPFPTQAKLIDTNPTSPFTSQIFADDFQLGDDGSGFTAPVSERLHSRWLYFQRNLNTDKGLMIAGIASATWQTGLRFEDISWNGGSALQDQLRASAGAPGARGLILQFVTYDTLYFNGDYFGVQGANQFPSMVKIRQLYVDYFSALEAYRKGETTQRPQPPCNRAYSRVTGWIGTWKTDEFVTIPGGRVLLPNLMPNQQPGLPAPQAVTPAQGGSAVPLGPGTVEAVGDETTDTLDRITVNLISTIPEWDSTGVRAELGPVHLGIMLPNQTEPTRLVTVVDDSDGTAYQDVYNQYAGLVDIPAASFDTRVSLSQFNSHPLVLLVGDTESASVVLTENPLNAQTNTRGLYVDEPGCAAGPTTHFVVDVTAFGLAPDDQVGLVVAQYGEQWQLVGEHRLVDLFYLTSSGDYAPIDDQTVVDGTSGSVTIGLRGVLPGLPYLVFYPVASGLLAGSALAPSAPMALPPGVHIPETVTWQTAAYYAAVRVLPFHNVAADVFAQWLATEHPDVDQVNHRVFSEVFETFHLMYPVMDFIGTPQKFQEWRGRILQVTDPRHFAASGYMPPTRSLSAGERRILELYDEYLNGVSAPGSPLRKPRQPSPPPRG